MATSGTAPLDLGAIEELERAYRHYEGARPGETGRDVSRKGTKLKEELFKHRMQLLAAARELAALKSALEFLEALDDDDVSPPCADVGEILSYARELGCTPGEK
jgi:hypothetical protein